MPLQVVTDENIGSFNVSTDPIHPAIFAGQLSMNHRVDYLRAYMMHHHGGGYHDVKPPGRSWSTVFDVYEDPHVWYAKTIVRRIYWDDQLVCFKLYVHVVCSV